MITSSPTVSVVIVTWNSEATVSGCLASLAEEAGLEPLEIFVIDNASSDRTVEVVRADAAARLIVNNSNRGLAAANNQGLAAARGRYLLICNPDVVYQPGAVSAMVEVMERHPRAGWVTPRLYYEDGALQTSAGNLPTLFDALFGRQVARRRKPGSPSGFWWDGWGHDEERVIGRGHEAAYLIRREALEEVGKQDEKYVLDWEGIDWADRFHQVGWEVWLAPQAGVVHLGGASIRQVPFRWVVSQHRGMYRYFSTRRPRRWRPVLALAFGFRALVKMASIGVGLPLYAWGHRDRRRARAESR